MPAFSANQESGIGIIPVSTRDEMRAVREFHSKRERERMNVPEEPEPIQEASIAQQVYIYNVSPWRYTQEMGSMGPFAIPALDEDKVLTDDLYVAGPLVIPGLPSEPYPAEGEAKRIYHRPLKNRGNLSKRPGLDFAMEVLGAGLRSNQESNLLRRGVFVSDQPEQKKPKPGASKEDVAAYERWAKDVKEAQKQLRGFCNRECQRANDEHAAGRFAAVREDKLYQMARFIKGNETQYPWLKDSGESAQRENCWACGSVVKIGAFKCPQCGEQLRSDAEMQAERERRKSMGMGSAPATPTTPTATSSTTTK